MATTCRRRTLTAAARGWRWNMRSPAPGSFPQRSITSTCLVEGRAVFELFGDATRCSSTKGASGHTLGAAGGVEAAFSVLALRNGFMPAGVNLSELDPALPLAYLQHNESRAPSRVLSNSFGFGGTNCSLVLGRADA